GRGYSGRGSKVRVRIVREIRRVNRSTPHLAYRKVILSNEKFLRFRRVCAFFMPLGLKTFVLMISMFMAYKSCEHSRATRLTAALVAAQVDTFNSSRNSSLARRLRQPG